MKDHPPSIDSKSYSDFWWWRFWPLSFPMACYMACLYPSKEDRARNTLNHTKILIDKGIALPPDEWPYGPPEFHEIGCKLFYAATDCDCKASAADDTEYGLGGWPTPV